MSIWQVEAETLDDLIEGRFTILGEQFNPCADCQEFDCDGCKFQVDDIKVEVSPSPTYVAGHNENDTVVIQDDLP